MIRYILILVSVVFILSGCRSKTDRLKPPKTVYKAEEMVDILVDIHLSEGVYKSRYKLKLKKKQDPEEYYRWVLQKHGIENDKLEESLIFYGRYPEHYREIYEKVLNRLNEMEAQIKVQEQKELEEKKAEKKEQLRLDSLKLVAERDSLLQLKDSLQIQDTIQVQDSILIRDTILVQDSIQVQDSILVRDTIQIQDTLKSIE